MPFAATTSDNGTVTLRIDITGMPPERLRFAVSPLAELTAMLHALAGTAHHPGFASWAAGVRGELRPELAERLQEAEFLWRSSRADFLLPARPKSSLKEELDDVDHLGDEAYVLSALVTTCGSNRVHFGEASPLTDAGARERALDQAQARGAVQEAFAERLLSDPGAVRRWVRETLEQCAVAFFDAAWSDVVARLAADAQVKTDLRERDGIGAALAAVSTAVTFTARGDGDQSIVVDKLQDNATSGQSAGVTLIPSVFGSPHLVAVHASGWRPVMQYPVADPGALDRAVSMDVIERRLQALSHPVRLRLVRTLARSPHTTGELAGAWQLTAPEVSRHLAVMRKTGLLLTERRGRYVYYSLDTSALTALGTDLLSAVLR